MSLQLFTDTLASLRAMGRNAEQQKVQDLAQRHGIRASPQLISLIADSHGIELESRYEALQQRFGISPPAMIRQRAEALRAGAKELSHRCLLVYDDVQFNPWMPKGWPPEVRKAKSAEWFAKNGLWLSRVNDKFNLGLELPAANAKSIDEKTVCDTVRVIQERAYKMNNEARRIVAEARLDAAKAKLAGLAGPHGAFELTELALLAALDVQSAQPK